jgi:hypothetical protein
LQLGTALPPGYLSNTSLSAVLPHCVNLDKAIVEALSVPSATNELSSPWLRALVAVRQFLATLGMKNPLVITPLLFAPDSDLAAWPFLSTLKLLESHTSASIDSTWRLLRTVSLVWQHALVKALLSTVEHHTLLKTLHQEIATAITSSDKLGVRKGIAAAICSHTLTSAALICLCSICAHRMGSERTTYSAGCYSQLLT